MSHKNWNTQTRGKKITKYTLTPEQMKELYGAPTTGLEKIKAEMASINEERMMRMGWGDEGEDVLDRESTPWQPEITISKGGAGAGGMLHGQY